MIFTTIAAVLEYIRTNELFAVTDAVCQELLAADMVLEIRKPVRGEFVGLVMDSALDVEFELFSKLMDFTPDLLAQGYLVQVHDRGDFDPHAQQGYLLSIR